MGDGNFVQHTFYNDRGAVLSSLCAGYISIFRLFTSGNFTHGCLFKVYIFSLPSG